MNSPPSSPGTIDFTKNPPKTESVEVFCEEIPTPPTPPSSSKKSQAPAVLIGSSITTTHVKDLHELLQTPQYFCLKLRLVFMLETTLNDKGFTGFSATVKLLDGAGTLIKEFQPDGCFPNKKHAKEAAAGLAINYVQNPENLGARMSAAQAAAAADADTGGQNWVGLLAEWCQRTRCLPEYLHYSRLGVGFSCEVRLPSENLGLADSGPKVFGDKSGFHRGKKQAKAAAAQAAVEWIEAQAGCSPLQSPRMVPAAAGGSAGAGVGARPKPGKVEIPRDTKPRQVLSLLCQRLNIEHTFKFDPYPDAVGMYEAYIIFRKRWSGARPARLGPQTCHGREKGKDDLAAKDGVKAWLLRSAEEVDVEIEWLT